VHVVEERDPRPPAPHRREPGHAVPDLDERIEAAHPLSQFRDDRAREDRVPASAPDHAITVAGGLCRDPDAGRCPVRHLEAGGGPAAHELVGVQLAPAGVRIVEVAPRQRVHPPHTTIDHVCRVLRDRPLAPVLHAAVDANAQDAEASGTAAGCVTTVSP
jgi:hypothetical protein